MTNFIHIYHKNIASLNGINITWKFWCAHDIIHGGCVVDEQQKYQSTNDLGQECAFYEYSTFCMYEIG